MVAALGPQGLWKFLFESSLEEQRANFANNVVNGYVNPRSFIRGTRRPNQFEGTYPPFIQICRDELVVGKGDRDWWNDCSTRTPLIDKTAVIWDDWRLKEWGYLFPTIKLPLYLPGQTPFHRFDCELSTSIVPYREARSSCIHYPTWLADV